MNLTPEILQELKVTDSITRHDLIVEAIENRTDEILKFINNIHYTSKIYWWAWKWYDGDDEPPAFDPNRNTGDGKLIYSLNDANPPVIIDKNGNEWDLQDSCPLRWLWEDYKEEVTNGVKLFKIKKEQLKEKNKSRREEIKQLKEKYCKSAKEKLTPEELWATALSNKMPKSLKHLQEE